MFGLADIKETRFYQDVKVECQLESVPRLLALGLTVEQIANALALDVELLKQAAENLLPTLPLRKILTIRLVGI